MIAKTTTRMPALKDSNIVKIAVELENQTAQLIEFDQRHPLTGKNSFFFRFVFCCCCCDSLMIILLKIT